MQKDTITEFLTWVDSFLNFEKLPQKNIFWLDMMQAMCNKLDNPQNSIACYHVAGSKGKGSVCAMISSILSASGKKIGVYSSPHIQDFRERIRLNDSFFCDQVYKNASDELYKKFNLFKNQLPKGRVVTWFELVTVFAFLCMKHAKVDEAVYEVGLGGRLDATNVITPQIAIINTIELEHTEFLGDTIEQIAKEKAGIIKSNILVLSAPQVECVKNVFIDIAKQKNAKLYFLDDFEFNSNFSYEFLKEQKLMNVKLSSTLFNRELNFNTKMFGKIQAQNALLSAIAVKLVHPQITETQIEQGLSKVTLPARFEIIQLKNDNKNQNVDLIIDGAHTVKSIELTLQTYDALYKTAIQNKNVNLLFACAADKDVSHIARLFTNRFDNVILTRPGNTKTCDEKKMQQAFNDANISFTYEQDFQKAIKNAINNSINSNQNLLVVGSFYLASEVKNYFIQCKHVRPVL